MRDARAWVRWWRIEGLQQMREILWEKWDPLGLKGIAPVDEYDSYAQVLASKLKRAGTTAATSSPTSPRNSGSRATSSLRHGRLGARKQRMR
jgi:hypothetical protein